MPTDGPVLGRQSVQYSSCRFSSTDYATAYSFKQGYNQHLVDNGDESLQKVCPVFVGNVIAPTPQENGEPFHKVARLIQTKRAKFLYRRFS
jgi:hypothetical protein